MSMDEQSNGKRKRIVCPVSTKDGRTFWRTMGTAFQNKDGSFNLYLDCLPTNGRLQVRDWDDNLFDRGRDRNQDGDGAGANLTLAAPGRSTAAAVSHEADIPF